jgi:hypothetical protein
VIANTLDIPDTLNISKQTQNSSFIPDSFIPDLVIYHNIVPGFACPDGLSSVWVACPDGLSSAWVAWKRYATFEFTPVFQGFTYDEEPPTLEGFQNVLVLDFSFSEAVLDHWVSIGKVVYVLDHHKAFKQRLEAGNNKKSFSLSDNLLQSSNILIDLKESGATLTWKVLFPDQKMPVFLEYIRDRDLFTKNLPWTDEVHAAYGKLQRSFNLYDNLAELDQETLIEFMQPYGTVSLDKKYLEIAKFMKRVEFWGDIPVVTLPKSSILLKNDLGEFLCKFYPFAKFCIILGKTLPEVRLRSSIYTWNTDLVTLFADLQAGGHSGACNIKWFGNSSQTLESLKEVILEHAERLENVDCNESLRIVTIAA